MSLEMINKANVYFETLKNSRKDEAYEPVDPAIAQARLDSPARLKAEFFNNKRAQRDPNSDDLIFADNAEGQAAKEEFNARLAAHTWQWQEDAIKDGKAERDKSGELKFVTPTPDQVVRWRMEEALAAKGYIERNANREWVFTPKAQRDAKLKAVGVSSKGFIAAGVMLSLLLPPVGIAILASTAIATGIAGLLGKKTFKAITKNKASKEQQVKQWGDAMQQENDLLNREVALSSPTASVDREPGGDPTPTPVPAPAPASPSPAAAPTSSAIRTSALASAPAPVDARVASSPAAPAGPLGASASPTVSLANRSQDANRRHSFGMGAYANAPHHSGTPSLSRTPPVSGASPISGASHTRVVNR